MHVLVCVSFSVLDTFDLMDVHVHVMLLESLSLLSVESPCRMQRAVEEEQPRLSSHLPVAPLALHLELLFADTDQAPSGTAEPRDSERRGWAEKGNMGFLSERGRDEEIEGKWDKEASLYLPPSS